MRHASSKEELRDEIIGAADRLFQHYGYRKTTVEDIAEECRMSRGTIYLHFRSKEEIALAWSAMRNDLRCEKLRAIAISEGSPVDRLKDMLKTRVFFSFDYAQKLTQSLDDLFLDLRSAFLDQRREYHEKEAQILCLVLEEGRDKGLLTFPDSISTARTLILITNALLPYSLSAKQLGERAEIEHSIDSITHLALEGLLVR
jgi:AcrR family transcriptional regulator